MAGRLELADADLQGISRLRTLDEDRPGDRVDLAEVELGEVGQRGRGGQLPAGRVQAFELDRRSWRDICAGASERSHPK
jgi:hypothetical protein